MTIIALCGCLTFGYSCFDITVMVLKPSPRIKRNSERGGMYTLRASFPAPSSKHCQNWLRHSRGTPLSPRSCLYRRRQRPPKGLYTDHTPSIAFRHLPTNSARFGYATEGALFIYGQLSTGAVSALRKVWVLYITVEFT